MSADPVSTFGDALAAHDVTWDRATQDSFAATLREAVREPIVGAPLPFEGVSLPDEVVVHPSADELRQAATGVTPAAAGIAEYGTVVVESRPGGDEPISLYPERHVAVLRERDLVDGMADALGAISDTMVDDGRSMVLTTGPSATGDMGALVTGVHGPHEVHVVLLEDE